MKIGLFGFGQPLGLWAALGLRGCDVTRDAPVPAPQVTPYIEPFMDPFAAAFLQRLAAGALNDLGAVIFLRESTGAVPAYQYACEFARRGLLPARAPAVILANILPVCGAAAQIFNQREVARILAALKACGWRPDAALPDCAAALDAVIAAQSSGGMSGEEAFALRMHPDAPDLGEQAKGGAATARQGPRLALLGGPMGSGALHQRLDNIGHLALDQQALDQAMAARGGGVEAALSAFAANPFAARQPRAAYVDAMASALCTHRIAHVFWQVEPHDDLWGWLAPQMRARCAALGIGFHDLGFVPRWPDAAALDGLALDTLALDAPAVGEGAR